MLTALADDVQLSCESACPAVETNYTCTVTGGLILSWKITKVGGTMPTITTHTFNGQIETELNKAIPVMQIEPVPFTYYYLTNVSTEPKRVTSIITLNGVSDSENYRVECGVSALVPCDVLLAGKYVQQPQAPLLLNALHSCITLTRLNPLYNCPCFMQYIL